jgi:hypothetical protein
VTTLYFAGAEQASHRNLLTDCGVTRFGINITNINRLVKPGWNVARHLPKDAEWVLYADAESTWEQAEPYVEQKPNLVIGPLDWVDHFVESDTFAPYWVEGVEVGAFPILALTDATAKNQATLKTIFSRYIDTLLVAVTGASRGVDRLDALVSSAWWAAQQYGETQVWTGTRLHRFAGSRKAEVRPKHRADIERLGISYERIEVDDPIETARLAITSWQHWEERHRRSNLVSLPSNEEYVDQEGMGSAHPHFGNGGGRIGHPMLVTARDRILLPGLGQEMVESRVVEEDGTERIETTATMRTIEEAMRRCDACYLSPNCPAYEAHASCAYKIPVVIKTKDQLQALMRTVIEVQGQRVMFARFAEEIEGQGLDGNLSEEIDRLFKIMLTAKDINDTRDVFRLEMEAKGNAGMISRLFGSQAGAAARELTLPVSSTEVMHAIDPE